MLDRGLLKFHDWVKYWKVEFRNLGPYVGINWQITNCDIVFSSTTKDTNFCFCTIDHPILKDLHYKQVISS